MKINYRLEVVYQVFEKKGKTFFETSNYVFNAKKSQQNRSDAININPLDFLISFFVKPGDIKRHISHKI